ncbi:hypothetical protein SPRG_09977 [Saprolegnia parasitica CBS 223.65]|uniref:Uncharacterized protein n=1 Tax=Saprolegnia parasitica (strain CBS 223.65) TaxID=695850 RepID=A0A067BXE0_SAPPC|nr:hypothetical protein SPRG_09977 [Saprolegnia parasitica CBS 223.65]KDO23169.1 hypothetical protein SPRG_09977 [Saprolegnia parasitica CBS 223.65]|eukprot:XP_012206121.1 hypothetical protein SPRG_09977 [Saprolegnia parasitica CBS 223.65]
MMIMEHHGWSDDERVKFADALAEFGSDWNRISRAIDSKSVQEVYEYATAYYKTMMSGKDLRSIETMKSSVCVSLLAEKLQQTAAGHCNNAKENSLVGNGNGTASSPCATAKEAAVPTEATSLPFELRDVSPSNRYYTTSIPPQVYKTGLSGNPYENRIKDLSDADIKLLLRKRILDMTRRKQENLAKRKLHETFASQQIMAFQAKHGVTATRLPSSSPDATAAKASKRSSRTAVLAPTNKKRKSPSSDGFAGVDALAMISCEELQKYHGRDEPSLTTPAGPQASFDFSIAPTNKDAKRAKWSAEEHDLFVDGLKRYGRKWKKVQEHVKTKSTEQVRNHANAYFATKPPSDTGDVLEVAGFLSSLAQAPTRGR